MSCLQPDADQPVTERSGSSAWAGGPTNTAPRSVTGQGLLGSGERMLLVMLVYLSGGTLKPRFLQAPAEHRENAPFTSHRWFLTFWEANESSGCSSQKCRHMHVLFGTQFQEIHLLLKPIPGSLDQYLDENNESFSVNATDQC